MFEKIFGKKEESEGDKTVSREELTALGIPENISMTRSELEKHLKTRDLQNVLAAKQSEHAPAALEKAMGEAMESMTDEEVMRANEAFQKNQGMGK